MYRDILYRITKRSPSANRERLRLGADLSAWLHINMYEVQSIKVQSKHLPLCAFECQFNNSCRVVRNVYPQEYQIASSRKLSQVVSESRMSLFPTDLCKHRIMTKINPLAMHLARLSVFQLVYDLGETGGTPFLWISSFSTRCGNVYLSTGGIPLFVVCRRYGADMNASVLSSPEPSNEKSVTEKRF